MRRFDEPIQVRDGLTGDDGPRPRMRFVWRQRLWTVTDVVGQWRETGPWWADFATTWADGQSVPEATLPSHHVWRVNAASGGGVHEGIFELAHCQNTGQWRLLTVVD